MAVELEETELYKVLNMALSSLHRLEDLTDYENEVIGECVNKLQMLDAKALCERYYHVVKGKEEPLSSNVGSMGTAYADI